MAPKKLISLLFFALSISAVPATLLPARGSPRDDSLRAVEKRATCSNGASVSDQSCCVWVDVLEDIQENLFSGGQCDAEAHESLRLTFHDAIGYSSALAAEGKWPGGGADGSILAFSDTETAFSANAGLDDIVELQKTFVEKHNVSPGDFIAFAGAVATSNCPGAPQMPFLAGRAPPTQASPPDLVPEPFDSVSKILNRVDDAGGFDEVDLVWLLASHSIASSNEIEPTNESFAFDTTPHTFDSQFFVETLLVGTGFPGSSRARGEVKSPFPNQIRLQSDFAIARDPRTSCEWQNFVNNQTKMMKNFQSVFQNLTLIGQNVDQLTNCSDVIPISTPLPTNRPVSYFPYGKTINDIQQSCATAPFPNLTTFSGPETSGTNVRACQRPRRHLG
ncbi:uncharacterized protein PHACADRAFT_152156 [Phanerochaete carnosa HHB-10118-sp]|uniref:Peroxidase n=1 Tax=Phanerochaete carnosa (strain HHB-10118-sp) TaxID=650164 RepID=K5VX94_PHACS|nr:uncharacterized protein PHACADRAFT_152156 [Phanerochaete carnosa HHB-10118-sp]EKM51420.1 hypothetical protein PHACADRAFT_152156 [Phanerochaete carnosa HHB-10118-sp]